MLHCEILAAWSTGLRVQTTTSDTERDRMRVPPGWIGERRRYWWLQTLIKSAPTRLEPEEVPIAEARKKRDVSLPSPSSKLYTLRKPARRMDLDKCLFSTLYENRTQHPNASTTNGTQTRLQVQRKHCHPTLVSHPLLYDNG